MGSFGYVLRSDLLIAFIIFVVITKEVVTSSTYQVFSY